MQRANPQQLRSSSTCQEPTAVVAPLVLQEGAFPGWVQQFLLMSSDLHPQIPGTSLKSISWLKCELGAGASPQGRCTEGEDSEQACCQSAARSVFPGAGGYRATLGGRGDGGVGRTDPKQGTPGAPGYMLSYP